MKNKVIQKQTPKTLARPPTVAQIARENLGRQQHGRNITWPMGPPKIHEQPRHSIQRSLALENRQIEAPMAVPTISVTSPSTFPHQTPTTFDPDIALSISQFQFEQPAQNGAKSSANPVSSQTPAQSGANPSANPVSSQAEGLFVWSRRNPTTTKSQPTPPSPSSPHFPSFVQPPRPNVPTPPPETPNQPSTNTSSQPNPATTPSSTDQLSSSREFEIPLTHLHLPAGKSTFPSPPVCELPLTARPTE